MVAGTLRRTLRHLRCALVRPRGILALRHGPATPFWHFLRWLAKQDPVLHASIDERYVGERVGALDDVRLVLNWTQDPIRDVDHAGYRWLRAIEVRARARGIRIVNRSEVQCRSRKSVQSRLLREAGFITPPVVPVEACPFPLVVRSDVEHSGRLWRFESPDELAAFDLSAVREPVAAPFVETQGPDGLYRKYRYFLAGGRGVPRHLQISRDWLVRMDHRALGPAFVEEELAYLEGPDPNHEMLEAARGALGLDLVAFDYGYRPDGSPVIWEANPLPMLWTIRNESPEFAYQRPALDRLYRELAGFLHDASRDTGR